MWRYVRETRKKRQQFIRGAFPESCWVRDARELKKVLDTPHPPIDPIEQVMSAFF
jgi:hypothetical protein